MYMFIANQLELCKLILMILRLMFLHDVLGSRNVFLECVKIPPQSSGVLTNISVELEQAQKLS